ncbi:MAG: major facilitator superfamily 1, partial [Frankiales bacterium]|nr:major facilitator superfamily 1 [Frankiales bacterium]
MPDLLPRRGPVRSFALVNLVATLGTGLWITGSALFFTQVVGLRVAQVGLGLSLATAVGLLLMVPLGRLADVVGPRRVYVVLLGLQGVATLAYVGVGSFRGFLGVACLAAVGDRGANAVVGSLVHAVAVGADRVATRAYLRAVTNVGVAVGSVAAAVVLQVDTRAGYLALVVATGLLLLTGATAAACVTLPGPVPQPTRTGARPSGALHDRRYWAVVAAYALSCLHYEVLSFALPLWVVLRTEAPRWTVSAVLVVNTLLVVALQVRVSRSARTVPAAAALAARAGLVLGGACLLLGLSGGLPAAGAVCLLLLFAVVYTWGEMAQASSEFCLAFELAPDDRQGDYQGVFALGRRRAGGAAPRRLPGGLQPPGPTGWLAAAAVL